MSDIIAQLRKIRIEQRCSQDALSALVGVNNRVQVSAWENGRVHPQYSTLHKWADALGYEVVLRKKQS
jgi:transcriptional regulator with XRE-family HTH domain